jgi:hypothetical protein
MGKAGIRRRDKPSGSSCSGLAGLVKICSNRSRMLRAELPQRLLPAEEQQAGVRHLAVAHRPQRQQEIRIAQGQQPGARVIPPQDITGPRDLDRVEIGGREIPRPLTAPVHRAGRDPRPDEPLAV